MIPAPITTVQQQLAESLESVFVEENYGDARLYDFGRKYGFRAQGKIYPRVILNYYNFGHPTLTWEEHALLFVEDPRTRSTLDALGEESRFEGYTDASLA